MSARTFLNGVDFFFREPHGNNMAPESAIIKPSGQRRHASQSAHASSEYIAMNCVSHGKRSYLQRET
jgi:hypothetical protein